jgi:hypothetical protein
LGTNSKIYNKKNYKKYRWTEEAISDRAKRNAARRKAVKEWKVKKWDWKEVDHKKWIDAGNGKANLRIVSMKVNRRAWAKKSLKIKRSKSNPLHYV